MDKPIYAACSHKDHWRVVRLYPHSQKPLGIVKSFKTFDEANKVAHEIAGGKYDLYRPGVYVNMR